MQHTSQYYHRVLSTGFQLLFEAAHIKVTGVIVRWGVKPGGFDMLAARQPQTNKIRDTAQLPCYVFICSKVSNKVIDEVQLLGVNQSSVNCVYGVLCHASRNAILQFKHVLQYITQAMTQLDINQ